MKKRSLLKMFLLEIVTLGIYRLYFLIKTRREMMDRNPSIKIKSPWLLIAPGLLFAVAFIFIVITAFNSTRSLAKCVAANPQNISSSNSTGFNSTTFNNSSFTSSTNTICKVSGGSGAAIGALLLYPLIFIAYVLFVIWEWGYSHGVEAITGNKLSFAVSLIILILVPDGIDILIIQDYFNKVGDSPMPTNNFAPPTQPISPTPAYIPPTPSQTPSETPPTNPIPPSYPQSPTAM